MKFIIAAIALLGFTIFSFAHEKEPNLPMVNSPRGIVHGKEPKPPAGVPADAVLFNDKWYRLYPQKCGWKTAKAKCEGLGGQMVIIHDRDTQNFIKKLADGFNLWLGASVEGGGWAWVDGTQMDYNAWNHGEPSGRGGCLMLTTIGAWSATTEDDGSSAGFVCVWKK